MKNKMGIMTLTGVLALTAAFSFTAFAEDKDTISSTQGGSSIIQGDIASMDIVPNDEAVQLKNYVTTTGKIESVTKADDYYTISIANDQMGMVFHSQEDVFVLNRKDNSYLKLTDLKEGMEITAIVSGNAPQTLSIPPQTSGAIGFVVNDGESFINVGTYDDKLVNDADKLQLNIDDKTAIVDQKGTKKEFTAEDVKNKDCLVFYSATTRSIPAQTSPEFVMILDTAATDEKDVKASPVQQEEATIQAEVLTPAIQAEQREMVALRGAAEAAGFSVKWQSNDQPVILEKEGVTLTVTVGQPSYTNNGQEANAQNAPVLKDAQIYISADVADILK